MIFRQLFDQRKWIGDKAWQCQPTIKKNASLREQSLVIEGVVVGVLRRGKTVDTLQ